MHVDRIPNELRKWAVRLLAAPLALVIAAPACNVTNPPGFEVLSAQDAVRISATPGHMYGHAPLHWTLPDGRQLRVEVERLELGPLPGTRSDIAFTLAWEDGGGPALRCTTQPDGPDVPETRLGCWTVDRPGKQRVQFWMAPDTGCSTDGSASKGERCWTGSLSSDAARYQLAFGNLNDWQGVVGRISWIAEGGEVAMAASIITEMVIELFPGPNYQRGRDELLLQTVALHWWFHARKGGRG